MDLKDAPKRAQCWESVVMGELSHDAHARHDLLGSLVGSSGAVHLAVFNEPYLSYILEGRKTVESRFSVNRCAPYRRVEQGDVLLLKRASGPIVAACRVEYTWFYELDEDTIETLKRTFSARLCALTPEFWEARSRARYATLMRVGEVIELDPIECGKRDRRGWVVLRERYSLPFSLEDA